MANNSNLGAAKAAKNDEFYTQYADIQKEVDVINSVMNGYPLGLIYFGYPKYWVEKT